MIDISPYKFNGPGGRGRPDNVRVTVQPDPYRGKYADRADAAAAYAQDVGDQLESFRSAGQGVGAFVVEAIQSVGGQVVPPPGYLAMSFDLVRAAGGLCVVDEVQTGLGRVGGDMWAFEEQGVVPDIVTMGKPLGNGHPLAAVVTTPAIARSFANGMEYFNTFAGNPVSAEIGHAVLDVLYDERLQENAAHLGDRLMVGLRELASRHPGIGDVRGRGLFLGVEFVHEGAHEGADRRPHAAHAVAVKEAAKRRGVLLSTDGPDNNVLKLKPPMVLSAADCDFFLEALDDALAETCRFLNG
jgi:4-aminobutyrate aminotransferase-like enzyme